ncbi:hypothetical protein PFICI_11484 [Pestalotiopsis fici W106-1]|uniref:Uncharacterized protein n=1 Tax=Pestalotiopsis fici (strain W106-1 / CGMCC3.15140) TaxID=1229662 RepID=W3WSE8_PESFW|nr:uncharacterized protein PFICI_11484 [Pestalotiopsis fici W106-1]ETS76097.1 hypothetical protein PFICI_11484 [Pestalotiopsis fici W106-1]
MNDEVRDGALLHSYSNEVPHHQHQESAIDAIQMTGQGSTQSAGSWETNHGYRSTTPDRCDARGLAPPTNAPVAPFHLPPVESHDQSRDSDSAKGSSAASGNMGDIHKYPKMYQSAESGSSTWRTGSTSTVKVSHRPALPLKESLGVVGLLSIFGGSLGALGVLGFLIFLWFGYGTEPEGKTATDLWRILALHNWMTQTITLCSLALRVLVSTQSIVCTSLVAALILEKRSVRKPDAAFFSVFRGVNDGPRKLVQLMLSHRPTAVLLYPEFWLLSLLSLIALSLQFSSTILLSDLHDFTIVGGINSTNVQSLFYVPEGHGPQWAMNFVDLLESTPVLSLFGERRINSSVPPDNNGFSDTGLVQQGLLPFADSNTRTSVRDYRGTGMVLNSRVSCMPPVMEVKYLLDEQLDNPVAPALAWLTGTLDAAASLRNSGQDISNCSAGTCETIGFRCNVPIVRPDFPIANYPQSSICIVSSGNSAPNLDSSMRWDSSSMPWSWGVPLYMAIVSNANVEDWPADNESHPITDGHRDGEWLSFTIAPDRYVNATLCFPALSTERYVVHLEAETALKEPVIPWNLTTLQSDTSEVENFLDVKSGNLSHMKRGIFDMDLHQEPDSGPALDVFPPADPNSTMTIGMLASRIPETLVYWNMGYAIGSNQTIPLCLGCYLAPVPIHYEFVALMGNIITSSGRAAYAVQSLIYMLTTGAYIESLKLNYPAEPVQLATTTVVRTPGPCSQYTCGGFISVATLIVVYLICVAAITTLYVGQVRYSRCGNIWHTISQLLSDDLYTLIANGNNAMDRAIAKDNCYKMKENLVGVEASEMDGGRVKFVNRNS